MTTTTTQTSPVEKLIDAAVKFAEVGATLMYRNKMNVVTWKDFDAKREAEATLIAALAEVQKARSET